MCHKNWTRMVLVGVLIAAPNRMSMAQGWPSWADDIFQDRSGRSERRYYYQQQPEPWERPAIPNTVQDGGARPDIAPRAPPIVAFSAVFPVNSIVIDTGARKLYFVLPNNRAFQYGISVGREGFNWSGTETVSRKQPWPEWHPPAEMRERDPKLPEKMTGGLRNPLGAIALYLGNTLYRIHGTNDVKSIGQAQSSGCFRMHNAEVLHLASITEVGTVVSVVSSLQNAPQVSQQPEPQRVAPHTGSPSPAPAEQPIQGTPSDQTINYRMLREQTLKKAFKPVQ